MFYLLSVYFEPKQSPLLDNYLLTVCQNRCRRWAFLPMCPQQVHSQHRLELHTPLAFNSQILQSEKLSSHHHFQQLAFLPEEQQWIYSMCKNPWALVYLDLFWWTAHSGLLPGLHRSLRTVIVMTALRPRPATKNA